MMISLRRELIQLAKLKLGLSPGDKISAALQLLTAQTGVLTLTHPTAAPGVALSPLEVRELLESNSPEAAARILKGPFLKMNETMSPNHSSPNNQKGFLNVEQVARDEDADGIPDELTGADLDANESPLPQIRMPNVPGIAAGRRGATSKSPNRASSPIRNMSSMQGHVPLYGAPGLDAVLEQQPSSMMSIATLISAQHKQELETLKDSLRKEMDAREEAQRAAQRTQQALAERSVELATLTAQRMDELLERLNHKHRRLRTRAREKNESYAAEPLVTSYNTVHSVTSVTMEDRYQDGDRGEQGRSRPKHRAREAPNPAIAGAVWDPQTLANQAWMASQTAVLPTQTGSRDPHDPTSSASLAA